MRPLDPFIRQAESAVVRVVERINIHIPHHEDVIRHHVNPMAAPERSPCIHVQFAIPCVQWDALMVQALPGLLDRSHAPSKPLAATAYVTSGRGSCQAMEMPDEVRPPVCRFSRQGMLPDGSVHPRRVVPPACGQVPVMANLSRAVRLDDITASPFCSCLASPPSRRCPGIQGISGRVVAMNVSGEVRGGGFDGLAGPLESAPCRAGCARQGSRRSEGVWFPLMGDGRIRISRRSGSSCIKRRVNCTKGHVRKAP